MVAGSQVMPTLEYICEFTDGSSAPVKVAGTWGKREMVGTAIRGDGKVRVVFFSDPNGDGWFIPRDGDRWVRNIRCPWASFGGRRPNAQAQVRAFEWVATEPPGARRVAQHLAARLAAEEWPTQEPVRQDQPGRKSA